MINTFIGIDPGNTGALACMYKDMLYVLPFEKDINKTRLWVSSALKAYDTSETKVVLERVTASPQMGVVSAFTFGRVSEMVESIPIVLGFDVDDVRPVKWQSALGCLFGDKKKIYEFAKEMFNGNHQVTRNTADACLIALYCKYKYSKTD